MPTRTFRIQEWLFDHPDRATSSGDGEHLSGLTLYQVCAVIRDREHGYDIEPGEYLRVKRQVTAEHKPYDMTAGEAAAMLEAGAVRRHADLFEFDVIEDRREEADA